MQNVHFQRGMLLYQQGRFAEAVGELRLQLAEGSEDALAHFGLALCLSRLEQHAEATEHAQQAIHLAPDQPLGHYALSQVMIARHRYDEARAAIHEAIRLDPYDADYFGILANLELLRSHWREALDAANRGLAIEPEHTLCTNMRAQALVKLGDRAAAAATMGEALARRPDDPYTHANQGWALLHQGKPYPAMEHFREALRLDPELAWARAGIVEALKARNILYRWMLAWFLWMARLTPQMRWGLVIGALFGSRVIQQMAQRSPRLAPFLWPVLYCYFGFVVLTWLAPSLFNLLLRLDRFGRYALSADQLRGANVLAACLVATLAALVASVALGSVFLLYCTLLLALLALPASAIFECDAGGPRTALAGITLALLAAVVMIVVVGLLETSLPAIAVAPIRGLLDIMPLALLGSQFAASYLVSVHPKK
jgi:tetratricopeptide (TPR) repeat protein